MSRPDISPPRALMICGTGSDAGKSVITAGLARAYANRGLRVEPFKPQNMSNNAAAVDGGEIGRAQALQARAARVEPCVHHNPVLLKPEGDRQSRVIVHGRPQSTLNARNWKDRRGLWMDAIQSSFQTLTPRADLILVEGAGSPAETNLRAGDVANLGFAQAAGVPILLLGDIDRGGVIASLVGTHTVLPPEDRQWIKGFAINKFRGDPALFETALNDISSRTGWSALGIIPWLKACARLPSEDGVILEAIRTPVTGNKPLIVIPMLSRISNFDDFDPLIAEPEVDVRFIPPGQPLPRTANAIILPGTKSTLADLTFLREQGWDIDITSHLRTGGKVFGVCGGFQMLGQTLSDLDGLDGPAGELSGLGLIPFDVIMQSDKITRPVQARTSWTATTSGYEIRSGRLKPAAAPIAGQPLYTLPDGPDGWLSECGQIAGGHLHGAFSADDFRAAFLSWLDLTSTLSGFEARVDAALDDIAKELETALDLDALLDLAEVPQWTP